MKIKCLPEDFVVEEVAKINLGKGKFSTYRLTKTGIGTLEALTQVSAAWNIPRSKFTYCGLKDRHAYTTQLISLEEGPEQSLSGHNWDFELVGKTSNPLSAKNLSANKFTIVVRNLNPDQAETLCNFSASRTRIPNYFDKQRFGSVTHDGQFPAVPWCQGNYERAVFLALAEHNPHDRPAQLAERDLINNNAQSPEAIAKLLKNLLSDLDLNSTSDPDDLKEELLYQSQERQTRLWEWIDKVARDADTRDETIKTFAEVIGSQFGLAGAVAAGSFKIIYTALTKARRKRKELPADYSNPFDASGL